MRRVHRGQNSQHSILQSFSIDFSKEKHSFRSYFESILRDLRTRLFKYLNFHPGLLLDAAGGHAHPPGERPRYWILPGRRRGQHHEAGRINQGLLFGLRPGTFQADSVHHGQVRGAGVRLLFITTNLYVPRSYIVFISSCYST